MFESPDFMAQTITLADYRRIEATLDRPITDFLFHPNRHYFPLGMTGKGSAALDRNRLLGNRNEL